MNGNRLSFFVFIGILSTILLIITTTERAEARPALDDVANVYETLRYLEELDRLYSQKARPRFGRSVANQQTRFPKLYNYGKSEVEPESQR